MAASPEVARQYVEPDYSAHKGQASHSNHESSIETVTASFLVYHKMKHFQFPMHIGFLFMSVMAQIAHAYLFVGSSMEHVESSTILSFRKLL